MTCYSFLLARATADHVPHFSLEVSLSIVGLSGASPQDVPGLSFTECQPVSTSHSYVVTKLFTLRPLIPHKFVAPPPFRNLSPN